MLWSVLATHVIGPICDPMPQEKKKKKKALFFFFPEVFLSHTCSLGVNSAHVWLCAWSLRPQDRIVQGWVCTQIRPSLGFFELHTEGSYPFLMENWSCFVWKTYPFCLKFYHGHIKINIYNSTLKNKTNGQNPHTLCLAFRSF